MILILIYYNTKLPIELTIIILLFSAQSIFINGEIKPSLIISNSSNFLL